MAKKNIQVYANGTQIMLGNKGNRTVKAEITAICLRPSHVRYEATWWTDGKKTEMWVGDGEFAVAKGQASKKITLGFKHE